MKNIKFTKLNLGCDRDYKEGYINVDYKNINKHDVEWNLNKIPYPFKDNTFEEIIANNVIEHLDSVADVMKELWRISKPGAKIHVIVPYYKSFNAFRDLSHYRFFTWDSFSPLCGFVSSREKNNIGYVNRLFRYSKRKLIFPLSHKPLLKQVFQIIDYFGNALHPEYVERYYPWVYEIINPEALEIEFIVVK